MSICLLYLGFKLSPRFYIYLCFGVVINGFGLALHFISSLYHPQSSSTSVLFTASLYNWKQPGASLAQFYQRNLSHYEMAEDDDNEGENCHVLTTALLTSLADLHCVSVPDTYGPSEVRALPSGVAAELTTTTQPLSLADLLVKFCN